MKKKKIKPIVAILLIALGIILVVAGLWKKSDTLYKEEQKKKLSFEEGIEVTAIESYSGAYVEDGSDEDVSDVMMITVKNTSEKTLQYAEVILKCGENTAEFAFSTIPAGESLCVMEKNRMPYSNNSKIENAELKNVVFFEEEVSMCEDVVEVTKLEGALNIKNISEKDISGPIAVYYKTVGDDMYHGGITYRTLVNEGLKAGEIRQVMTKHFSMKNSEIMFVTYVP